MITLIVVAGCRDIHSFIDTFLFFRIMHKFENDVETFPFVKVLDTYVNVLFKEDEFLFSLLARFTLSFHIMTCTEKKNKQKKRAAIRD